MIKDKYLLKYNENKIYLQKQLLELSIKKIFKLMIEAYVFF